jgi:hypothetical protein
VGIYAGTKTMSKGEYVMEIGETLLDGSPRGMINCSTWGGSMIGIGEDRNRIAKYMKEELL